MSIIGEIHETYEDKMWVLIKLQKEYIEFLGNELSRDAMYMHIHHMSPSEEAVNKGIEFRRLLKEAEENIKFE